MASAVETDINDIRWSVKGYPVYDLVARYPFPLWTKTATSPKGDSGIEAHQIYRIKRLLQIQTIISDVIEDSDAPEGKGLTLCIPQDYNGLFQILPVEHGMLNDISLQDVVKYQPRYIQVVEKVSNITTGVKIELNPGDQLEVLGTRLRATKSGVQDYLKLKKQFREFVLNPDCVGKFKVITDTTEYSIADILQRCSLPQKVKLVDPESHSNTLLEYFTAIDKTPVVFMLKDKFQDEYVIGEDRQKINGIVLHSDTDMYFYVPESVDPSYIAKEESKLIKQKSSNRDEDEININHFICKRGAKPIFRGPVEILFKNLVLPPRPKNLGSSVQKSHLHAAYFQEGGDDYGNIEFKVGKSWEEKFGKIGTDSQLTLNRRRGCLPSIPSKPSIANAGEIEHTRTMLMTPKETQEYITGKIDTETNDDDDYDTPESEGNSPTNTPSVRRRDSYEFVNFKGEEDTDSDDDTGHYEEIDDCLDRYNVTETQATVNADGYMRMTKRPQLANQYVNTHLTEMHNRKRANGGARSNHLQTTTDHADSDSPPPLPTKHYDQPKSLQRRPIEPKYSESVPTELPLNYRNSVRNVERLSQPYVCTETPPEPPPRTESAAHPTREKIDREPSPRRESTTHLTREKVDHEPTPRRESATLLSSQLQNVDLNSSHQNPPSSNPDIVEENSVNPNLHDVIERNSPGEVSQPRSIKSLPTEQELQGLSEDEIVEVLKLLNFNSFVQEKFKENGVDGTLFINLDYEILTKEFEVSSFHALKIMKFINGWRPMI